MTSNAEYLATYSDDGAEIKFWDRETMVAMASLEKEQLGGASKANGRVFFNDIGAMALTPKSILITGDSTRIRVWDPRENIANPAQDIQLSGSAEVPQKWIGHKAVSGCMKVRYVEPLHQVAANFSGGNGIFTFDLRMCQPLEYYRAHYYPTSDIDTGDNFLSHIGVSTGPTQKLRYEVRFSDLSKSAEENSHAHALVPGHKAIITKVRLLNDKVVTGTKNGSLIVS